TRTATRLVSRVVDSRGHGQHTSQATNPPRYCRLSCVSRLLSRVHPARGGPIDVCRTSARCGSRLARACRGDRRRHGRARAVGPWTGARVVLPSRALPSAQGKGIVADGWISLMLQNVGWKLGTLPNQFLDSPKFTGNMLHSLY